jgi:hypothetical protein
MSHQPTKIPDDEAHWVVLSAEFLTAMAFHGERAKPVKSPTQERKK